MDGERTADPASGPDKSELHDVGAASIEPVQAGGGLVAEHGIRTEAEQPEPLPPFDRVRRPDDGVDARSCLDEEVSVHGRPQL